jgi:hypothetical protein
MFSRLTRGVDPLSGIADTTKTEAARGFVLAGEFLNSSRRTFARAALRSRANHPNCDGTLT